MIKEKSLLFFLTFGLIVLFSCNEKNKTVIENIDAKSEMQQRVTSLNAEEIIDKNATTFILVRHAEKEKDVKDPELSEKGKARALELTRLLAPVKFSGYYSTNFRRTKETAEYVASLRYRGQDVKIYDHKNLKGAAKQMKADHPKGVILISGHSNTTPKMINILTGSENWQPLSEFDYDNLYIVSVYEDGLSKVRHFKYGASNH